MRTLGSITVNDVSANQVNFFWFVQIEIPDDTFVRYTDMPSDFTGDEISGDNVTWTSYDFKVGTITQNQSSPLDVSYIDLGNADNIWSDYTLVDGARYRHVKLWQAWFDPDTDAFIGSLMMYDGRTDEIHLGTRARIALSPHATPWSQMVPARRFLPTCTYVFKEENTCQYVGVDTVCLKTLADCQARTGGSNEAHFGGFLNMPDPQTKITWGDVHTLPDPQPWPFTILPLAVDRMPVEPTNRDRHTTDINPGGGSISRTDPRS